MDISKKILALTLMATLMSCSAGFQSQLSSTELQPGDSTNPGLSDGLNTPDTQELWSKAQDEINGQVSGGAYDGNTVVEILPDRQSIALVVPLPPIFLAPLVPIEVPQLPGVEVEYRQNGDGTYNLVVIVPIRYVIRGSSLAPYGRLPNGDAIPFMPSGESRGFAVAFAQQPKYRVHFYFVANAVGVFIETPDWKLPDELSAMPTIGFPVRNRNQTQINGYFAIVPNKANHASGLFVSSRIPRELAFELDQILRY